MISDGPERKGRSSLMVSLQKSPVLRRTGRTMSRAIGRGTAELRMLPDFLLVGAQRSGTTSLHRALASHPAVLTPMFHKGVHYFDADYARGFRWYRGHFPLAALSRVRVRVEEVPARTFESSGYYMHHPLALERIQRDLPNVRLIAMLRNPVERAYSAHRHELARGFEPERSFERALALEPQRLDGEVAKMRSHPDYVSFSHRHHSYMDRGQYAEQITNMLRLFGPARVHVLDSESFFARPHEAYREVLQFLGLPPFTPSSFDQHNAQPRGDMSEATRRALSQHFEPFDDALEQLLGRCVGWRSTTSRGAR